MDKPTVENHESNAIAGLNAALRACEDGERGYRAAATEVTDAGYRLLFDRNAEERARFAKELDRTIRGLGAEPARRGSSLGALHRGWLEAKALVEHGRPKAVLVECRRGEESALEAYRAALHAELPPGIREVVQDQYEAIKKAEAEIATLVDAGAP